jgi:hypothetical protein
MDAEHTRTPTTRWIRIGIKFAFTFGFGALGIVATGMAWRFFGTPGAIFYFLVGTAGGMLLLYVTAPAAAHLGAHFRVLDEICEATA